MHPQGLFVPLLIILISSLSFSYGGAMQKLFIPNNNHHQKAVETTSSLDIGNDIDISFKSKLTSLMGYNSRNKDVTLLHHVGTRPISSYVVNVDDFGAKGDGTDDSKAFEEAWNEACSSHKAAVLVVPKYRVYHLKPITFSGPCNYALTLQIQGTIKASNKQSDYKADRRRWLAFENVKNFNVEGGGTINGNGKIWWRDSCKINKRLPCLGAPTAATFYQCENLRVSNLISRNSPQIHISFQKCVNVIVSNLLVVAPGKSPNTDGIHVTDTQNIQIMKSVIRTGDDCISIVDGSKSIQITDIVCGPGHGISIGSLGKDRAEDHVSDVLVNRVRLLGTTNGVRIKTWQGGSGYARNIIFQNIAMTNVSNPIIIDQNYCDQTKACPRQYLAVQVQNVMYKNIRGTSASEDAIKFDCSQTFPCEGISLQNVDIRRQGEGDIQGLCDNVNLSTRGRIFPNCS